MAAAYAVDASVPNVVVVVVVVAAEAAVVVVVACSNSSGAPELFGFRFSLVGAPVRYSLF